MILIELVQRLEPGDRRLVYRELPRHVLAGLPRGLLLSRPARLLSPASALLLSALRSTLLPRRGLGAAVAAPMARVLARVAATGTLTTPFLRHHAAPGILALRLRSFIERAVSTPVFTPSEGGRLTVPSVGLLLRGDGYSQIDRLTLRPRGPGAAVERRLQRRRERGRLRRDGQPRRARRRGGRLPRGRSTEQTVRRAGLNLPISIPVPVPVSVPVPVARRNRRRLRLARRSLHQRRCPAALSRDSPRGSRHHLDAGALPGRVECLLEQAQDQSDVAGHRVL